MLLEDGFRVLLLVSLICVTGITPAAAQGQKICNSTEQVCAVDQTNASLVGCVHASTCGNPLPADRDFVCNDNATNCCCAGPGCAIQAKACNHPKLKDLGTCKGGGSEPSKEKGKGTATTFTPPPIGTMILLAFVAASLGLGSVS